MAQDKTNCCIECHLSFEEHELFPYLPPEIANQIYVAHQALRAHGFPEDEVKEHTEWEEQYFRKYLPPHLLNKVVADHRAMLTHDEIKSAFARGLRASVAEAGGLDIQPSYHLQYIPFIPREYLRQKETGAPPSIIETRKHRKERGGCSGCARGCNCLERTNPPIVSMMAAGQPPEATGGPHRAHFRTFAGIRYEAVNPAAMQYFLRNLHRFGGQLPL